MLKLSLRPIIYHLSIAECFDGILSHFRWLNIFCKSQFFPSRFSFINGCWNRQKHSTSTHSTIHENKGYSRTTIQSAIICYPIASCVCLCVYNFFYIKFRTLAMRIAIVFRSVLLKMIKWIHSSVINLSSACTSFACVMHWMYSNQHSWFGACRGIRMGFVADKQSLFVVFFSFFFK